MPGRLAVDFGTSNTVAAVWDEARRQGVTLRLPDYGMALQPGGAESEAVFVVPSLIHYADAQRRWLGKQVHEHNVYESEATFRWMKRYIAHRNPVKRRIHGLEVTHADAGREFLAS